MSRWPENTEDFAVGLMTPTCDEGKGNEGNMANEGDVVNEETWVYADNLKTVAPTLALPDQQAALPSACSWSLKSARRPQ